MFVELFPKSAVFDVFHRFFRHIDTAIMISQIFIANSKSRTILLTHGRYPDSIPKFPASKKLNSDD